MKTILFIMSFCGLCGLANADIINMNNNTSSPLRFEVNSNKCYSYNSGDGNFVVPANSTYAFYDYARYKCLILNDNIWLYFKVSRPSSSGVWLTMGETWFTLTKHGEYNMVFDEGPKAFYTAMGYYDSGSGYLPLSVKYGFNEYSGSITNIYPNTDGSANITYSFKDNYTTDIHWDFLKQVGIAADKDANLFVVDRGGIKKVIFNNIFGYSGFIRLPTIPSKSYQSDSASYIAVDGNDNLFVSDPDENTIWEIKYDANTASYKTPYQLTTPSIGALNNPHGIATDSSGDVFVADTGNNRVVELMSDGNGGFPFDVVLPSPKISYMDHGYIDPYGIAVGAYGSIYITDAGFLNGKYGDAKVYKLMGNPRNGYTNPPTLIPGEFTNPLSIAEDIVTGNLYVADAGANSISQIAWNNTSMKYESPVAISSSVSLSEPTSILYIPKLDSVFVSNTESSLITKIIAKHFWPE